MIIEWKSAAIALFLIVSFMMVGNKVRGDSENGKRPANNGADSTDLYQMSQSGFFEQAKVKDTINLEDINYNLLAAAIFHKTNQKRKEHDIEHLSHLPRLDEASRMHAQDMAENEYVAHINKREQELRTPSERVLEVGLTNIRYVAENVASHFGTKYESGKTIFPIKKDGDTEYAYQPEGKPIANHTYGSFAGSLVDSWMNSPGHRHNILSGEPKFLGTGCSIGTADKGPVKLYCVQLFFDKF